MRSRRPGKRKKGKEKIDTGKEAKTQGKPVVGEAKGSRDPVPLSPAGNSVDRGSNYRCTQAEATRANGEGDGLGIETRRHCMRRCTQASGPVVFACTMCVSTLVSTVTASHGVAIPATRRRRRAHMQQKPRVPFRRKAQSVVCSGQYCWADALGVGETCKREKWSSVRGKVSR